MTAGSRLKSITIFAAVALTASFVLAPTAGAVFHFMKIREVHFDTTADDDYIELQMYADGQSQVGGHFVRMYTATGAPQAAFMIPTNVANGQNQRTILIGNNTATTPAADFNSGNIEPNLTGGAACFLDNLGTPDVGMPDVGIDCVAWGTFDGSFDEGTPSPVGAAAQPAGMADDDSLVRSITANNPNLLEDGDDTGSSVGDFALGTPTPCPNSALQTPTVCDFFSAPVIPPVTNLPVTTPPATNPTAPKKCRKGQKLKKGKCVKRKKKE